MSNEKYNNIWDALFDDKAESASLKIKTELMDKIRYYIKRNNITQLQASKIMKVSQPRISDVVRGKISQFTIDSLVEMLSYVDISIKLSYSPVKVEPWFNFGVITGGRGKRKSKSKAKWGIDIAPSTSYPNHTRHNNEYASAS